MESNPLFPRRVLPFKASCSFSAWGCGMDYPWDDVDRAIAGVHPKGVIEGVIKGTPHIRIVVVRGIV